MKGMIKATYEDHMGDDLRVVNAARVSFGKRSEYHTYMDYSDGRTDDLGEPQGIFRKELKDADKRLIQFLARGCESREWQDNVDILWNGTNDHEIERILKWAKSMPTHWTPFGHTAITLIEEIPIFVARQRFKHTVGFVYNEISRRYVTEEPTFYHPEGYRMAAENKKQGSTDEVFYDESHHSARYFQISSENDAVAAYRSLLTMGVCAEQARMVLPQSMMTTYWVTGNLYSFAQAYKARSRPDAQKEIRDLAAEWDRIIRPLFPVSWSALVD
ncbi:thymidylate synthase (FAD) [Microvirga flocculans]|uniref:FAD-dependent thymidylate synthase n=1 Tax=Microvirga flocculans TaxID=217168 RepID=A0A7W6ICV3_9HYPH|nr:FAD-dependent thymidylate synthase [Microvirga flocculans]MBB4039132.1 thymidylate synthase (FAD) [Microvirga flocculans]